MPGPIRSPRLLEAIRKKLIELTPPVQAEQGLPSPKKDSES